MALLDPSLLMALALLLGQRAATSPWPVAVLMLGVAGVLWHARKRSWALLVLLLAALSGARATRSLLDADVSRRRAWLELHSPMQCAAEGIIEGSPVHQNDGYRVDVALRAIDCDGRAVSPLRARLYTDHAELARGDRARVLATLAPVQLFRNPELPDPRPASARGGIVASGGADELVIVARASGIRAWIDRARYGVRERILQSYPARTAPFARALVLGEGDLEEEDNDAFRASGLAHLLAVSGTHLVLVVLGFAGLLRRLLSWIPSLAQRYDTGALAATVAIPFAFIYADFAGGSGSALRAAAMMAVSLGARALGRRGSGPRALGVSVTVFAFLDPLVAFDLSFLLSLAATGGLIGLRSPCRSALDRLLVGPLARLGEPLSITLAASLACAPVLSLITPSFPLLGMLANMVAVPLGELAALPLCLAHALLPWCPPLERLAALAASGALLLLRAVAHITAALPWGKLPFPSLSAAQWSVLGAGALASSLLKKRRAPVLAFVAAALLALGFQDVHRAAPTGVLRVTHLDVGQGDSTLIDLPDGRLMLLDGGGFVGSPVDPGKRVLLPLLRARHRDHIDVMVLSHPHPDHFTGLAAVAAALPVGELWDTGQGEDEGAGPLYESFLARLRAQGTRVLHPAQLCHEAHVFGGARVRVLAPCDHYTPFANANDNSLVLSVRLGHRGALFVGDAEHAEEEQLLRAYPTELASDVLKVGHHGSRTSSGAAFLRAVHPGLAVISAGARNRFGHPHPTTLRTLQELGIPVHRTDSRGGLIWETDGETIREVAVGPS